MLGSRKEVAGHTGGRLDVNVNVIFAVSGENCAANGRTDGHDDEDGEEPDDL